MVKSLYLDHETFNAVSVTDVGTYAYAEHPSLERLLTTWSKGRGDIYDWDATDTDARDREEDRFYSAVDDADEFVAHGAMFDRNISRATLDHPKLLERDRWRCTMAKAYFHGFPGGLDALCRILKVPEESAKIKEGKALIRRFCGPAPRNHKADRYDRWSHPDEWDRFVRYGRQDIAAMRIVDDRLPSWNDDPDLYHLDQRINDRGMQIDRELVEAGRTESARESIRLKKRFQEIVGPGALEAPTQREKFKDYMGERFGLDLPNTQAETLEGIQAELDEGEIAHELIEIALRANKTSTAKYAKLAPALSSDDRFRGGLQVSGAARTRRWSGRVFQPHNLPSRGLPKYDQIELFISALKTGMVSELSFDNQVLLASAALRGAVVAPEGRWLSVADLSNIEGRVNAWFAGERWKLQAFADYDTFLVGNHGGPVIGEDGKPIRKGPDLYRVTAAQMLSKDIDDVTQEDRDKIGKVAELAFGYQGGVGALQNFASGQMSALMDMIREDLHQYLDLAIDNYERWGQEKATVDETEWLASESIKLAWRARHPRIVQLWKDTEEAARKAIQRPGTTWSTGRLAFRAQSHAGFSYLLCRMPSGNYLVYFNPRCINDDLTYLGLDGEKKAWTVQSLYGGKIVENVCQSFARDILAANMPEAERRGFDIVLTVHDELVTESDEPRSAELASIMSILPEWAAGLPLAAAGFDCKRYRKG